MTKLWSKAKRFSVVRLAKVSDMDSTFNPAAVGAIRACEGGLKKQQMGLLCGAWGGRTVDPSAVFSDPSRMLVQLPPQL